MFVDIRIEGIVTVSCWTLTIQMLRHFQVGYDMARFEKAGKKSVVLPSDVNVHVYLYLTMMNIITNGQFVKLSNHGLVSICLWRSTEVFGFIHLLPSTACFGLYDTFWPISRVAIIKTFWPPYTNGQRVKVDEIVAYGND